MSTRNTAASAERYERGTRSYTMSHIRGKDTSIEVMVRRYLFARGLRFRKNDKRYPGHPDVVLPKWRAIVFVNGCFWHMHDGCAKHTMPKSNVEFWSAKLLRNRERDRRQHAELEAAGWNVIVVWECELARPVRQARLDRLYEQIVGHAAAGGVALDDPDAADAADGSDAAGAPACPNECPQVVPSAAGAVDDATTMKASARPAANR